MLKLFVMVGISGSGKSTYAEKLRTKLLQEGEKVDVVVMEPARVNLRGIPFDIKQMHKNYVEAHERIRHNLSQSITTIFDTNNLAKEDRDLAVSIGREFRAKLIAIVLNTPLTESIKRNNSRENKVHHNTIWRQQNRFLSPIPGEFDIVHHIDLGK
jgi:predicted kinase